MYALWFILFWPLLLVAILVPIGLSRPLFRWANRLLAKQERRATQQAWLIQAVTTLVLAGYMLWLFSLVH
jgi:hypothetical protein